MGGGADALAVGLEMIGRDLRAQSNPSYAPVEVGIFSKNCCRDGRRFVAQLHAHVVPQERVLRPSAAAADSRFN